MIDIDFEKYKITTMTCVGNIFGANKVGTQIRIFDLVLKLIKLNSPWISYIKMMDVFEKIDLMEPYFTNKFIKCNNPWYGVFNANNTAIIPCLMLNNIIYTYNFDKNIVTIALIKGEKFKKKKTAKVKVSKKKIPDFKNSFSIEIPISETIVANCKIYRNGRIQITGCRSQENLNYVLTIINYEFIRAHNQNVKEIQSKKITTIDKNEIIPGFMLRSIIPEYLSDASINELLTKYPIEKIEPGLLHILNYDYYMDNIIFSDEVSVNFVKFACIMASIRFKETCSVRLDLNRLFDYISSVQNYSLFAIFDNSNNKSFQLEYRTPEGNTITYMIFNSGKIVMTHIVDFKQLEYGYKFITNFIIDNIKHFMLTNIIDKAIKLVNVKVDQRSQEWFDLRKKCVTASELGALLVKNFPYKTYEEYISEKAKGIKGEDTHFSNEFTLHGQMFEPIAQQYYVRLINSDNSLPYKILHYDVGFYTNDTKDIGASPDGILFKFDNKTPISYLDNNNKEVLTKYKKDILDTFLIEIKCPSHYKPVKNGLYKSKEHYYWQVQQQLYVTGLKYCIFMNNDFRILKKDEWSNVTTKLKGVFYCVKYCTETTDSLGLTKNGETEMKCLYPKNHYTTDEKEIELLAIAELQRLKANKKYKVLEAKKIYWILNAFDVTEVDYDKELYEKQLPKLKKAREEFINMAKK